MEVDDLLIEALGRVDGHVNEIADGLSPGVLTTEPGVDPPNVRGAGRRRVGPPEGVRGWR